jgi:hypothetical protein
MSMHDVVNERLNYSKQIIKQISHINGISDELSDVLELAFAGMLAHYGQEALNEIYVAFLKTKFVICNEPLDEFLMKKYNVSKSALSEVLSHAPGTFYEVTGNEFIDKNHKRTYKFNRVLYVQNDEDVDKATLLRSVIHQVNHVLNSINNPVVSVQGRIAARMGISLDVFASRENMHIKAEEAINAMQCEEIMNEIYEFLLVDIENEDIRRNLNEVASCPRHEVVDDSLTEILRPLYEDDFFKNILVDKRISGRLSGIRAEFESYTDVGSYGTLLTSCDVVASTNDEEEKVRCTETAKQLVKKYLAVSDEDN